MIGALLSSVSYATLVDQGKKDDRHTIKVLFYDRQGYVAVFEGGKRKKDHRKKVNFPGGGVKECFLKCLYRECLEELTKFHLKRKTLGKSVIIHQARVPTSRKKWTHKNLVLVAMRVKYLRALKSDGWELGKCRVTRIEDAVKWIKQQTRTHKEVRDAYITALKQIRKLHKG